MRSPTPSRDTAVLHLQPGNETSRLHDGRMVSDTIELDAGNDWPTVEEVTPTEIDMVFAALGSRLMELFDAKSS
jgi:hypothetical protein